MLLNGYSPWLASNIEESYENWQFILYFNYFNFKFSNGDNFFKFSNGDNSSNGKFIFICKKLKIDKIL